MPGTPTSSRDAQAGAPVLPGELPYSSTPPGPGAASTTAPAPAAPGVLPPSLSMAGAFPSAPASFGPYPYSAGGQVYFPMYGQGLPSAPLSSGSMGAAYAPPLPAGMPMVGMRPPGYGASYVDDRRSHPDPAPAPRHAHDRAYPRSYAPRHAARPGAAAGAAASAGAVAVPGPGTNTGAGTGASVGPGLAPGAVLGVDEIPRVSPLPALPRHSRDGPAPEFVPGGSSGQLTPHVARLQAQAPRFTPSPSRGLRSESSARDASVPEAPVSTYVHSRLPPLEPLPSGPGAVRDEELQQLPEGVKAYISGLESLVATYKKRENEHALRLEALAFNPVLALRQGPKNDVSVVTQAEESEAGTEGKIKTTTTPEAMAESKTKTETGLDQAADPELHPAPILGLRLLHRVQELTEENEELGRTLEKRLFPVADSVQTDPEEFESMRADLEGMYPFLSTAWGHRRRLTFRRCAHPARAFGCGCGSCK